MSAKTTLIVLIAIVCNGLLHAQHAEHNSLPETESIKNTHRITLSMAQAHIREGLKNEEGVTGITVCSWALDYDYWFSNHWAIGLHSDLLLENFTIMPAYEKEGGELERSYPLATVPVLLYKPWQHLLFMGGVGAELAKEDNFMVYRLGTEFSWPVNKNWELGLSATYDVKKHSYDTWLLGFGISRLFHSKK